MDIPISPETITALLQKSPDHIRLEAELARLRAIITDAEHHESCPRALSADYLCDCPVGKLQKKMEKLNGKV